jgi:hypothetical protein
MPMLKTIRITGDDRRFIAVYVIGMIAVTVRIVTVVLVVVVMGVTRSVVVMDVRMVSSAVAMIEGAHYIDLIRPNRKWSLHTCKEKSKGRNQVTRCAQRGLRPRISSCANSWQFYNTSSCGA